MRTLHTVLVAAAVVALSSGCKKDAAAIASIGSDSVVAQFDVGKVGLSVGADGAVKAAVESPDGKPISKDATGTVAFKTTGATEAKSVPLAFDGSSGALTAAGPKLDGDLTEVSYSINAGGKTLADTVFLPAGGTAQLAADAKATTTTSASTGAAAGATATAGGTAAAGVGAAAAASGPHGGTVQVVGTDKLEVVSDGTDQVRVYVLAADGTTTVPVEKRVVTIGVVGAAPETVVLAAEPGGRYLRGVWHVHGDPMHLTIACRADANAQEKVALVGYTPGAAMVVGAAAPHVKVTTNAKLADDEAVAAGAKLEGNGNPIGTGMGKGKGEINGNAGAQGGAGAGAGASLGAAAGANGHAEANGHGNGSGAGNGGGNGNGHAAAGANAGANAGHGKAEAHGSLDLKVK
jgi:hypothetical protein